MSLKFLGIILEVLRNEFLYTMFTLQTSSNHFCSGGGGGGIKSVSSGDFCPNTSKNSASGIHVKPWLHAHLKVISAPFSSHFGTFVYTNIHTDHTVMYVKTRCIMYQLLRQQIFFSLWILRFTVLWYLN
jgi:hypothetical protein